MGAAPFGSLIAGAVAHRIGAPHTTLLTGTFCILGSIWFTLRLPQVKAAMRPIYREKGLIPSPTSELAREEMALAEEGVRS
jgi:hypothetical protein